MTVYSLRAFRNFGAGGLFEITRRRVLLFTGCCRPSAVVIMNGPGILPPKCTAMEFLKQIEYDNKPGVMNCAKPGTAAALLVALHQGL